MATRRTGTTQPWQDYGRATLGASLTLLAACGGDAYGRPVEPATVVNEPAVLVIAGDRTTAPGKTGPEMVLVPAGPFLRGCAPQDGMCFANERPARTIHLSGFLIDRTEVTVAAYRACVSQGSCSDEGLELHTEGRTTSHAPGQGHNTTRLDKPSASPTCNYATPGRERHPINCVTWDQARAFCAWAGKRLPTEAEWEKAARGQDERIYAWGDAPPTCGVAVIDEGGLGCGKNNTAQVGSRPRGQSPAGAMDMIGNVTEWVSDWYQEDYYASSPEVDPPGPPVGRFHVVRGGTWKNRIVGQINGLRSSNRYSYIPTARLDYVGFRCAQDAR